MNDGILDVKQRVGEDGMIVLPYNLTVRARGKTPPALAQEIRAAFVPKYYGELSVLVTNMSPLVDLTILGEVGRPGRQHTQWGSTWTVLRAIDAAGGLTPDADLRNIQLWRRNGKVVKVDWDKACKNRGLDPELLYPSGDLIIVPSRRR